MTKKAMVTIIAAHQRHEISLSMLSLFLALNLLASSCCHGVVAVTKEEEEADRIASLPGQPKVSFQQFSGYVAVNKVPGRALFYWLTEATHNPLNKPLVVWLNGAKDSLQFLIRWMDRFPRYKGREVYLTGESYAGHYVPQLAREIMIHNSKSKHPINLKGIMVGNAVTDNYYDNLGTVTYWWSHAMISDKTYQQLINTCDFRRQKESDECESLYTYAMDQEFGNIDQYNIYAAPCNNSDGSAAATRHLMRLPHRPHNYKTLRRISGYDPCTEKYAEIYYNRPDVQKALHANKTKIPYKWTACSEVLNRNWNDTDVSVLPIYRKMIAGGLRVWVFSGDVDSVVPVTATRYSLAQLKLTTKIPWYPWYVKKQVGGWTEVYEGLTFATVRGAGHEVPLFKPRAALQLFKSFLRGDPLPKSR
ncbi:serine carboxypeptidase-like 25 isoform X3 [Citrus clementina]|uniref:serine carboxypeptidase-like 25 isoform X3 n=1 Tax=Citrus clementina TaxID=85681 RepID=UPI000CECF0B6|nr:serine carboxypeptidase-like 25 isoform X3 [Citrus x clementina]